MTFWVVLAMTGAFVYLAGSLWFSIASSRFNFPKTQYLSTAEVQNLIANAKGGGINFFLNQCQKGFRFLQGEVREDDTPVSALPSYYFAAPAENSTLALLEEKGIGYKKIVNNRDFSLASEAVFWLRRWAPMVMAPFCFFIVVAGMATLMRRRNHQPFEPRPIAAARNERRVDKAFAALVACGMVAVAIFLGLATDWKVRRVAAHQVPGIIAQHKNARFEVYEYPDSSRKLWISDLHAPDFIAPLTNPRSEC
ncbi:MAG: hypothetical protein ACLQVY_17070 [Limisphaerales bacterium]